MLRADEVLRCLVLGAAGGRRGAESAGSGAATAGTAAAAAGGGVHASSSHAGQGGASCTASGE